MTLYRISTWDNEIYPVEYDRVTDKFAFRSVGRTRPEVRDALVTSFGCLGKTREEAIQWKASSLSTAICKAKREYDLAIAKEEAFDNYLKELKKNVP